LSTGSISIPNPYDPTKFSVFKDWQVNGWVDMRKAIAFSCNIYFYEVGGGFEGQKGLGIGNIEKYARMFGLGAETGVDLPRESDGVIPNPTWKEEVFNGDQWRLGDTYNTSIGQYGFQTTPLQMARAIGAVASDGLLVTPTILKNENGEPNKKSEQIQIPKEDFKVVKEGMRMTVTDSTAQALNLPEVKVAVKTGTAQVGTKNQFINAWVVGFFPYENPRYSFAVLMEKSPATNLVGSVHVMAETLKWMASSTPEYLK
jgi:penicillin-binding protein 2